MSRDAVKLAGIIERSLNIYGKYILGSSDKDYLEKVNDNLNIEHDFSIEEKVLGSSTKYRGIFTLKMENLEDA
ncbi:MAG: hypothetical protein Q8Q04_02475 [archaeon]|nr:hypothetical protein [archaeon]